MNALSKRLVWLVPLGSIGMLAAGQVWLSHLRYETAQTIHNLQESKRGIAADVTRLNLEVASLTRPERLREIAGAKLGMQPPRPMQVVHP